jgi:hypothetical protein
VAQGALGAAAIIPREGQHKASNVPNFVMMIGGCYIRLACGLVCGSEALKPPVAPNSVGEYVG